MAVTPRRFAGQDGNIHHFPPSPSSGPAAPSSCRPQDISGCISTTDSARKATSCHRWGPAVPFCLDAHPDHGLRAGRLELSLALLEGGHDVTVIDKNPEAFSRSPGEGARQMVGLGFDRELLEEAGSRRGRLHRRFVRR